MSNASKPPGYMAQLLDALGWDQGTRIPLADSNNKELETQLINRQNELQRLKEAYIAQKQKCDDLSKYKAYVQTENQENTRLLFAHKQQMEQEVKLRQLACNEADRLERDLSDCHKQSRDINTRVDRFQGNISKLLKKADGLKSEVCGERGALQEWRAALERNACDITAIEQFSKIDNSQAKALETKRQKLKLEHDRLHERLVQLVSNLSAEERACDRVSVQVIEGMEERKQLMHLWTSAVENLRQRDTDIRHIREDYAVLEAEAGKLADQCREQQAFYDQQRGNNNDAMQENALLSRQLSNLRSAYQAVIDNNISLESETNSLQRELQNVRSMLEKLHMESRQIREEQQKRVVMLQELAVKLADLREKVADSKDRSKSSEKRAKELEDMLNEEERYANAITANQERAIHCSFKEQQKLLAVQNEQKLFRMRLKACKATMETLKVKQRDLQKCLQSQKEALYLICYQVETVGARVSHMEGAKAELEFDDTLVIREERLKGVCARHAARVLLLERHSAKLTDDMRRLMKDLELSTGQHVKLLTRLKAAMLSVEGGEKELRSQRDALRKMRVEEALLRLRLAHASRSLARLDDTAYTLDEQRLQINAAMNERLVEINARRDMFSVQKRALYEECGRLKCEIREREQRIEQLIKRYDIFMASLGKDESGQQLSLTFFKIKFAAERAELRERGSALDKDIGRRERDVSALEATLRVVHAAHHHFMHHISPLHTDTPEMEEVHGLNKKYYELRDELKEVNTKTAALEKYVADATVSLTQLMDKHKQLSAREAESEQELEENRERMQRQQVHLQNSRLVVSRNVKRAKKLVEGVGAWRLFQLAIWNREYSAAAYKVLCELWEMCCSHEEMSARVLVLATANDLPALVPKDQKLLYNLANKITNEKPTKDKKFSSPSIESLFSPSTVSVHSGVSMASGYTRRLTAFRQTIGPKLNEPSLMDDVPEEADRATISLRVVTLGMEDARIVRGESTMRSSTVQRRRHQ